MIGTVEVRKRKWIGKIEAKIEEKFGQMHFRPFVPVQFSYLRGTRAHEVPASTAQKILRSYLHLIGLT